MQSQDTIIEWKKYIHLQQQNLIYNPQDQDYEYTVVDNPVINRITLLNVCFSNEFPNIVQEYSQFSIIVNNTEYKIVIDQEKWDSFYNIFELIQLVVDELNSQTTFTFSIDTGGNINKQTQITCNQLFRLKYDKNLRQNNRILAYLGFDSILDEAFNFDKLSHLSQSHYNVQVTQSVRIQMFGVNQLNSDLNTLIQIPLSQNFELTTFQTPYQEFCQHIISQDQPMGLGNLIHIRLLDDLGFKIRLLGSNLSATVLLERYARP